jgi:hypothetical protein
MYLPPLFPTLLRTTGAGFCYNIGRIAAALGTVFFGLFSKVGDYRLALLYAGFLFIPAAVHPRGGRGPGLAGAAGRAAGPCGGPCPCRRSAAGVGKLKDGGP